MPVKPPSPRLLVLIGIALTLLVVVQFGVITIAFDKLGLAPESAATLLFVSLIGSGINLPMFTLRSNVPLTDPRPEWLRDFIRPIPVRYPGRVLISINVGGALIPCAFSIYLLTHTPVTLPEAVAGTTVLTALSYTVSRPIGRFGIGMPALVAPLATAFVAILIAPDHSAPLAYISGTLGVVIGADALRLKNIRDMGAPQASIGGAGTFDGVFITGIIAALLA